MDPYYSGELVTLYLGDCREVLPSLGIVADCIVADPPYGDTSLTWDRWPDGWLGTAADVTSSLWCFGSLRMFMVQRDEFAAAKWKLSQDVVWEKNAGTGVFTDRFRKVHELAVLWYQGIWRDIYREAPRVPAEPLWSGRNNGPLGSSVRHYDSHTHLGPLGEGKWREDGTRLMRSVIRAKNLRGLAIHPTEKPVPLLRTLIQYACPADGLVIDPFAGSASTLDAARQSGRRAIGIEADECYLERAARRLSQGVLAMPP